jgi:hypothetical protein
MKENWQNFLSSVLLNQLLPLLPLLVEFLSHDHISDKSLTLTASMYGFTTGFSSKQKIIFSLCLFMGILMACVLGSYREDQDATLLSLNSFIILIVFGTHFAERYDRHVNDDEIFFLFYKNQKEIGK